MSHKNLNLISFLYKSELNDKQMNHDIKMLYCKLYKYALTADSINHGLHHFKKKKKVGE